MTLVSYLLNVVCHCNWDSVSVTSSFTPLGDFLKRRVVFLSTHFPMVLTATRFHPFRVLDFRPRRRSQLLAALLRFSVWCHPVSPCDLGDCPPEGYFREVVYRSFFFTRKSMALFFQPLVGGHGIPQEARVFLFQPPLSDLESSMRSSARLRALTLQGGV